MAVCHSCRDAEPLTCDYVWEDSNGDVWFDGETVEQLMAFLAHHVFEDIVRGCYEIA